MSGPVPPRMSLAERATWRLRHLLLARSKPGAAQTEPLVVAGFFRTASGIGQSARACAAGLRRHSFDPVCVDLSAAFGQVDFEPDIALSPMPKAREGALILHANAPETERALHHLRLWRNRDWRVIGYWAWELPQAPQSWLASARYLSELWTPSEFVAGAFREKLSIPVKAAPHYIETPPADEIETSSGAPLRCLAMGDARSSLARKNLEGAVAAFRLAAGARSDVALTVKTRNLAEFPEAAASLAAQIGEDARITLIDRALARGEHERLIAESDIYISLHRSEGFGLVIAEAMAAGKAVVATHWSGNVDFMDETCAMAVPFSLVPVNDPSGVYKPPGAAEWAEPDIDAGAKALAALFDDAPLRARLGQAARARVAAALDGAGYGRALRNEPAHQP